MISRIKNPKFIKLAAASTGLLVIFMGYNFFVSHKQKAEVIAEVYATPLKLKNVPITVSEIGNVAANQSVAIKSRIDSQITEVLFKDGDKVIKGQVLVKLDDRTAKKNLSKFEAGLAHDQAQLGFLERDYNRLLGIYRSGYETTRDLDNAKSAYDAQIAIVDASKAMVENAKVLLDYTVITAPISGRTGITKLTVGNEVKANDTTPIITINEVDPAKVKFSLSQKHYPAIKEAMRKGNIPITAEIPESKEKLKGRLENIENTFDQNDAFAVQGLIENDYEKLWPGMYVNVEVDLGNEINVIAVPEYVVRAGQNQSYVYVVEGETIKKKHVKVRRTEKDLLVIEGLKEGEILVMDGFMKIADGMKVKVAIKE